MDTQKLIVAIAALNKAREDLAALKYQRSLLNCSGHQQEIAISFSGGNGSKPCVIAISWPTSAYNSYASKIIRGREMMALGAIKAVDALIDDAAGRVAEAESLVRKHAEAR